MLENAKMCAGYSISEGSRVPYPVLVAAYLFLSVAWDLPCHLVAKLICKRRGCDWVDESWGNPDSGGEGGYCKRCGYSFSITYY